MKRIIYIGDFKASYSTERYIAHALKELGYEVMCKQEDNFFIGNADMMAYEVEMYKPILVMFSKGKPIGQSKQFIEILKNKGIPTCSWLFDLYFDLPVDRAFRLREKDAPFNSDVVYTTDGGHHKQFAELDIVSKTLRQGIHEPEAILYNRPLTHDIIFVGGNVYKTRTEMLAGLANRYANFERYGHQTGSIVRGLPLNELYSSTKVVVGDSQPSPHYWSNRLYETLGRGGFLLHPHTEGIETEFEDGKHLVLYDRNDLQDLYDKIDYYLSHDTERETIRRAGFELVKGHYTYKDRCRELMKNYE
jgi:hypothetical protein